MTTTTSPTKQRPGTRLMATGLVIIAIGILLIIIGFSTSHMEFIPGTFSRVEVPGAPTPVAWIVFIVGLVMSAAGFGKRVLASIEK